MTAAEMRLESDLEFYRRKAMERDERREPDPAD